MTTSTDRERVAVLDHPRGGLLSRATQVRPSVWGWLTLSVLLVATGAGLYYLTRNTTFYFDEWNFILYRRADDLGTFLRPYNGHFSLIPIVIYRLLFAVVGLTDYGPYRALMIVAFLLCVALVFVYARRRVGNFLALCAAGLVLWLGPGWPDMIWPFQIAWLISLGAGLGALLAVDRRTRGGDVAAAVLLMVALASSSVGDVFALGVAVDLLVGRRRWRELWIVAAPLAVYGLWWAFYEQSQQLSAARQLPGFILNTAASSFAALAGRAGNVASGGSGTLLEWGRPLLAIAIALLVWRLVYLKRIPARVLALLVVLASFWFATALTRAWLLDGSQAFAGRYLFASGFVIVILAAELVKGLSIPRPAEILLGVAVIVAAASNIGALRDGANGLRQSAQLARADLGALEIGRRSVNPNYVSVGFPGFPFIAIKAGPYFAAVRSWGSPADTPAEIAKQSESVRVLADQELIRIYQIAPRPGARTLAAGTPPHIAAASGEAVHVSGACVAFAPRRDVTGQAMTVLEVPHSSPSVVLKPGGGPATVAVRRFADGFTLVGAVQASTPSTLRIAPGLAVQPWYVRIVSRGPVTACGLR